MKTPFFGPTYTGRSTNISSSRCVNFFPEIYPPGGKSKGALIGTPGLSLFVTVGTGAIRGSCFFNNLMYIVSGGGLYSISQSGVQSASLMTLSTSTGRVWMANNGLSPTGGNQLAITDGVNLYIWNVKTSTATTVSSWPANIVNPQTVVYIGGYFVVAGSSGSYQVSALYDGTTWNALDVAAKANSPDPLISAFNNHGELWNHGSYTTEIWAQSAGVHPPFVWISGAIMDYGSAAKDSLAKGSNTIFWLANRRNGESGEFIGAVMASGYNAQVISPPSIVYQWKQYSVISDAWGYCYSDEGHEFYVLTFPTASATWVYDATTELWHERSGYTNAPYVVGRHWGNAYTSAWGNHYLGDYRNGNIYQMSSAFYNDNGTPIVSFRTAEHLFDPNSLKNRVMSKFQLDAETGLGIAPVIIGYHQNLLTQNQADVETDLTGLTALSDQSSHTFTQDTTTSWQGISSAKLVSNYVGTQSIVIEILNLPVIAGKIYSFSVHPKALAASGRQIQLLLTWWTAGLVFISSNSTLANASDFSEFSNVITVQGTAPVGAAIAYVQLYLANCLQNEILWWDGAQFELGTPTTWISPLSGVTPIYGPYGDPQTTLSWSNDGGHTWSSEYQASLGKIGTYKTRVIWRRLGYSRDRVYRITCSESVKKVFIDTYEEAVTS